MQFFPADIFAQAAALPAKTLGNSGSVKTEAFSAATGVEGSFKDIFASLSAYNPKNTIGVPVTERSTRNDNSYFKSDDFSFLKKKLLELGVSSNMADKYFQQLAGEGSNPTIGELRGAVSQMFSGTRATKPLDEQDTLKFHTILSQLGFDQQEITEIDGMMERGEGLKILQVIQKKTEGKEFELSKAELDLIVSACDLYGDSLKPVSDLWENSGLADDDKITVNSNMFKKLFGAAMGVLEKYDFDLKGLAEKIDDGIQAMLDNRKIQPNEPVADVRGSALTDRSETMSRILATLVKEDDDEENKSGSSHLIDDNDSGKAHKKSSIASTLLNNDKTEKALKEERESATRAELRGEEPVKDTTNAKAAAQVVSGAAQAQKPQPATEQQNSAKGEAQARATAGQAFAEAAQAENSGDNSGKTRQDFYGQQQSAAKPDDAKSALNSKVQEGGVTFSVFGQTENSSASSQSPQSAKTQIYHERIFEQVERGIIKNATDGSKQIVLRLDPPELGKLTLSLTVAQGEVKALIRTESSATTQVVSEQLAQLKQSLEEQGFKVSSLEVETRAQSHAGTDNWNGEAQHNQEQQMLEQSRFLRLARARAREGETLAQSMQHIEQPASISASGLHIIA